MSDTTKRLDLQFGSFACSVQGFDDPVQPVQQVLQALQNLLEETPELGDAGISFDAASIDRLIGEVARRADLDERNIEIVPGLIIVHHRHDGAVGYPDTDDVDTQIAGTADEAGNTRGGGGQQEPDDENPGYVNIFSPARNTDGATKAKVGSGLFPTVADDAFDDDDDDELELVSDPFAARLDRMATADDAGKSGAGSWEDSPIRDIFAEIDSRSDDGDHVFAELRAEMDRAGAGDQTDPSGIFAANNDVDPDAGDVPGNAGRNAGLLFSSSAADDEDEPEGQEGEPVRGAALFGEAEDQPEAAATDDGYTANGIAKAAGAEGVSELMVSAAAWMVLIQGQTTFSRSDVVEVFEAMSGKHDKSLEARIRGFGKALRNGQFVKVEEGVYGLSRDELERFQRLL